MGELAMQFSLQIALYPMCYVMRTIMGMFMFAFWVISTQNVKQIFFVVDGKHACMPGQ